MARVIHTDSRIIDRPNPGLSARKVADQRRQIISMLKVESSNCGKSIGMFERLTLAELQQLRFLITSAFERGKSWTGGES